MFNNVIYVLHLNEYEELNTEQHTNDLLSHNETIMHNQDHYFIYFTIRHNWCSLGYPVTNVNPHICDIVRVQNKVKEEPFILTKNYLCTSY